MPTGNCPLQEMDGRCGRGVEEPAGADGFNSRFFRRKSGVTTFSPTASEAIVCGHLSLKSVYAKTDRSVESQLAQLSLPPLSVPPEPVGDHVVKAVFPKVSPSMRPVASFWARRIPDFTPNRPRQE